MTNELICEMAKALGFVRSARAGLAVALYKDKQVVTFAAVEGGWMYKWERGPGLTLAEGSVHKDFAGAFQAWFADVAEYAEQWLANAKAKAANS